MSEHHRESLPICYLIGRQATCLPFGRVVISLPQTAEKHEVMILALQEPGQGASQIHEAVRHWNWLTETNVGIVGDVSVSPMSSTK